LHQALQWDYEIENKKPDLVCKNSVFDDKFNYTVRPLSLLKQDETPACTSTSNGAFAFVGLRRDKFRSMNNEDPPEKKEK
jgi:hypothetical protein